MVKLPLTGLRAQLASAGTAVLILALACLLAWLSTRFPFVADWTSAGRHTLSPASVKLLGKLSGPLEITAYAREEPALRDAVRRVISRYHRYKPDLSLQFVNPDVVPDEVRSRRNLPALPGGWGGLTQTQRQMLIQKPVAGD